MPKLPRPPITRTVVVALTMTSLVLLGTKAGAQGADESFDADAEAGSDRPQPAPPEERSKPSQPPQDDGFVGGDEEAGDEAELRDWPVVETGPQAGFRTGFAMGWGKFSTESEELSDASRGFIPLWFDAGYRVHPSVYVGIYGQVGFLLLRRGGVCEGEDTQCSGQNYRVGANLHFHFVPDGAADPWVGIGTGYEWYRNSVSYSEAGIRPTTVTFSGFELVNLQAGLDIKDTRQGGVGPFVAVTIAQYKNTAASGSGLPGGVDSISESITNVELHQWVIFGIQGSYFDQL